MKMSLKYKNNTSNGNWAFH